MVDIYAIPVSEGAENPKAFIAEVFWRRMTEFDPSSIDADACKWAATQWYAGIEEGHRRGDRKGARDALVGFGIAAILAGICMTGAYFSPKETVVRTAQRSEKAVVIGRQLVPAAKEYRVNEGVFLLNPFAGLLFPYEHSDPAEYLVTLDIDGTSTTLDNRVLFESAMEGSVVDVDVRERYRVRTSYTGATLERSFSGYDVLFATEGSEE